MGREAIILTRFSASMRELHNAANENGSKDTGNIADNTGSKGMPHFLYRSNAKVQGEYIKNSFAASYHDRSCPPDEGIHPIILHDSLCKYERAAS